MNQQEEITELLSAGEEMRNVLEDCGGIDNLPQELQNRISWALQHWLNTSVVRAHLSQPHTEPTCKVCDISNPKKQEN
jgi:hypothetical protein